jgi:hypothetical protein
MKQSFLSRIIAALFAPLSGRSKNDSVSDSSSLGLTNAQVDDWNAGRQTTVHKLPSVRLADKADAAKFELDVTWEDQR